ncbi:MAG: serine/threonine protein kinase [Lachnospiraceae bacterium]
MNLENRLELSFYRKIATLNEAHQIDLVQDSRDQKIYVQKFLPHYNKAVYEQLLRCPIPNIPCLHEIFEDTENHRLILLEEYISGKSLEEMLEEHHRFSEEEIRYIICSLCSTLHLLHSSVLPIIHRDIKPSNIMMTPSGKIILLDLNAARLAQGEKSEDTELLGTKGYAAPEQYGFSSSGIQTDIYAIGMLMNTLALGTFSPTPIEGSPFTKIIQKCVQLDYKKRYKNVNEIAHRLSLGRRRKNVSGSDMRRGGMYSDMRRGKFHASGSDAHQGKSEVLRSDTHQGKSATRYLRFLPPGFRSLNPLKMFVATILYLFIGWMSFSMESEGTAFQSVVLMRTSLFLICLGFIYITGNYLNIQQHFFLCHSRHRILRWIGTLLLNCIYLICMLILMVFINMLLA